VLIYTSAPAAARPAGRAEAIEQAFRGLAKGLAAAGARRFVVAGGETSGAVAEALGVKALAIGPEIAPGVPWTASLGGEPMLLALKSGNFGGPDFFMKAFETLP
jgi:3-dehydrotetronate 4-kinase